MRLPAAVVAVALLLPSLATAQLRAPGIDGPRRGGHLPTGRQPEAIARAQALIRSRYSVEVYPLISRVAASGAVAGSPTARWTSFGTGTRLDWRHTDHLSSTIDVTASYLGGNAVSETAEVGLRVRPANWSDRLHPFADLRVGFEHTSQSLTNQDLGFLATPIQSSPIRFGHGFGAVAGAGAEYFLSNTLGLTTALSVMRSSMTAYDYSGVSVPTAEPNYRLTTYRLAVGLRYNRVRYLGHVTSTAP
jgi:hypothetical protein